MKLADLDFRIWDKTKEAFLKQEPTLIRLDNERVIAGRISRFYANTADIADMFIGNGNDLEIELWSGFYDKNGKKIYEGDIVCFKNRGKYNDDRDEVLAKHIKEKCLKKTFLAQIFFKNVGGGYCIEREVKRGKKYLGKRYFSLFDMSFYLNFRLEVVGNIHENATLLNGGEK